MAKSRIKIRMEISCGMSAYQHANARLLILMAVSLRTNPR